jgi:lambda repressor-like predicted transcriptional regulator
MTAKEYLAQALHIDGGIKAKLEQVRSLRDLSTLVSATFSDMPRNATRNVHKTEDIIAKFLDIETEINADIARLLDLKRDIAALIAKVENPTYRSLLELRYLCFKQWDDVATIMRYDRRYTLKLHGRALREADTKRQGKEQ